MKAQELSKLTGLKRSTIRTYEEQGLLAPDIEERNGRLYRDYSEEDVERLRVIVGLRKALFSMEQIKLMLDDPALIPALLESHKKKIKSLSASLAALEAALETIDTPPESAAMLTDRLEEAGAGTLSLPRADIAPHFRYLDERYPDPQTPYPDGTRSLRRLFLWFCLGLLGMAALAALFYFGGRLVPQIKPSSIVRNVRPAEEEIVLRPNIPADYDAETVLELGKCPGPGFEGLKESGLDGQGLGVAIIGGVLCTEHKEYKDNLMLYEEIGVEANAPPVDSASWAASAAVGKNCGVAPGASLYYIAVDEEYADQEIYVQALRRLIEINQQLPRAQKIRAAVINKSFRGEKLSDELKQAMRDAVVALIYVICDNDSNNYDLYRTDAAIYSPEKVTRTDPLSDPTDPQSYTPYTAPIQTSITRITFESDSTLPKYNRVQYNNLHLATGARTLASADGGYAFFQDGVDNLEQAYVAGLYLLAIQVNSKINPKRFYEEALQDSAFVLNDSFVAADGKTKEYKNLHMANPAAMIALLQKKVGN